jgi:hypothetical protein
MKTLRLVTLFLVVLLVGACGIAESASPGVDDLDDEVLADTGDAAGDVTDDAADAPDAASDTEDDTINDPAADAGDNAAAADPCEPRSVGEPTILVVSPQDGAEVASPFTVEGCAAFIYESNIVWELVVDGEVVASGFTTAHTEEIDRLAPFSFEVSYGAGLAGSQATLAAFGESGEDGSRMGETILELKLGGS